MKMTTIRQMHNNEKQITPLPGEISPKDAHTRAAAFAVREIQQIKTKLNKTVPLHSKEKKEH